MILLKTITILLVFPALISLLVFAPMMSENEIFRNILAHEIFCILIVPIYLTVATTKLREVESSSRIGILFALSLLSIIISIQTTFRAYAFPLWNTDLISKAVAVTIILFAIIVYFISYFIFAKVVKWKWKKML